MVIHEFAKDKFHVPNGWTIEFFLEFFDIIGVELLAAMEDSRIKDKIHGALNATFLSLIPKCASPSSFIEFLPISCCNLIYKVISKIISIRIKETLSRCLSKEQSEFLHKNQILDAINVVQEVFPCINTKRLKAMVLKLDLMKARDRVDWTFLHLILLQIGHPLYITN